MSVISGFQPNILDYSTSDIYSDPVVNEDPDEDFEPQAKPALSKCAQLISGGLKEEGATATSEKIAFIWLQAKGENDLAFNSEEYKKDRSANIGYLNRLGYEVKVFESGRSFLDGIQEAQSKSQEVDLLIFSAHGNPTKCGDLVVKEEKIIFKSPNLTVDEQENGFDSIKEVMAEDSIVVFDSCSTGNKSVHNNIGRISSEILRSSAVFAPQCPVYDEPMLKFNDNHKKGDMINRVEYLRPDSTFPYNPPKYVEGQDVMKQEAEPYIVRNSLTNVVNNIIDMSSTAFASVSNWFSAHCA